MADSSASQIRVEQGKLTDVLPDQQNANKHKARGASALEKSLRSRGFFRPTAAFGKGVEKPVMGAGNLTQETAVSIGMEDAIFIYTDGTKPIVHVRTDIAPDSKEARALALEDNRVAELSLDWDVEVIASFDADILEGLWTPEELSDLGQAWAGEQPSLDDLANQYGEPEERDFWPVIKVQVSPETKAKYDALMAELPGADEAAKFDALVSGTVVP